MLVGHNSSDSTFGWADALDSITIYYTDAGTLEESSGHLGDHSHTLVPQLSTEVEIKMETTIYKNNPYTHCNATQEYSTRVRVRKTSRG